MDKLVLPKVTKEIIQKYGFRFSKQLGQNFLIDENILQKIVKGAAVSKEDRIIEVGPGIGTLTQALAQRAERVIAVEIDKNLIPILKETLSPYSNVKIIHGDILKVDFHELMEEESESPIKVIANLPYYATTPIVMKFLEERWPLHSLTLMVQKEVAERMRAAPGGKDYGALSVAVQYYCDVEMIAKVPKTVFIPQPNVDSAVIRLTLLPEPNVQLKDERIFFAVVKAAFGQRRKMLLNALAGSTLGFDKETIHQVFIQTGIDGSRRGESLTIEEFAKLANAFYDRIP